MHIIWKQLFLWHKRIQNFNFPTVTRPTYILYVSIPVQSLAKNLEQSEVKDWLESTKETLMGDR
jgi:hypothetical protein